MQQLSIFTAPQPTPAPAKVLQFRQLEPTKESGLEGDRNIATQPPEPAQTEALRVTEIAKNKSPLVSAKPLPSNDLTGKEWVQEYYRMAEPIKPGDRVRTRAGKEGVITNWQFDEKDLPGGMPRVNWNSPDAIPGLRGTLVATDTSKQRVYLAMFRLGYWLAAVVVEDAEEECFYAYQLTKIKSRKTDNLTAATVSGDELSQAPAQESKCGESTNSITATIPAKKPDLITATVSAPTPFLLINQQNSKVNHENSQDSGTARDTSFLKTNQEIPATTKPDSDPISNDAPKPLILPAGKPLTPISKEESNNTGKILTFTITTDRAELLQVADPLLIGQKTCSRRLPAIWTPQTTAWYQRAFEEKSNIQAWSAMPLCKKKNPRKLADLRLTTPLYLEALKDMPEEDLEAEGGLWKTKEDFIETVCKGKPDLSLKFWVLRFELVNICV